MKVLAIDLLKALFFLAVTDASHKHCKAFCKVSKEAQHLYSIDSEYCV